MPRPLMQRLSIAAAALGLLAGCATAPNSLYAWGPFPEAVAQSLRESGGDAARQAALLEAHLERSAVQKWPAPPGLHAHLALLYTQLRDEPAALRHLEAEKRLFPESAAYMDFLLKNARPPGQSAP